MASVDSSRIRRRWAILNAIGELITTFAAADGFHNTFASAMDALDWADDPTHVSNTPCYMVEVFTRDPVS